MSADERAMLECISEGVKSSTWTPASMFSMICAPSWRSPRFNRLFSLIHLCQVLPGNQTGYVVDMVNRFPGGLIL